MGFGLLAGSAYAGYWYGSESVKFKTQSAKPQLKTQIQETPTSGATPSPITDPTANWKTYINKTFNYSVKYPSDWSVTEEQTSQGELARQSFRTAERDFTDPTSAAAELVLVVATEKPNSERLASIGVVGGGATSTFGNVSGLVYESEGTGIAGSLFRMDFIFEEGLQVYWVHLSTGMQSEMLYKPTFNQVLSTFKFLD